MRSIQTTVVGSYPVPGWLSQARTLEALRDATLAVLKIQENAGLDLLSDGELTRFDRDHPDTNGMIDYFLAPMEGIDTRLTRADLEEFRRGEIARYRREPAAVLRAPLGEGRLNLPRDWSLVRGLTSRPLKFTCTGPHMLSKVLLDHHYRDIEQLSLRLAEVLRAQLAEIDAAIVQIDEANIPGSPADGPWAARAINLALSGVRGEKAVHVCFGNYGGQTIQRGEWSRLLEFLNALEVDCLILECSRRPEQEVAALKEVRAGIALGLGVVDVKDNQVETPEQVARRIERFGERVGGVERVRYVHPDCGLWMLPRSVADRKMVALVAGRDLFLGSRA